MSRYNHRDLKPYEKKGLYDKEGYFLPQIRIAGWLYPGGTEKHVAVSGGGTRLQETPEGFMSLLFAPIACSYYQVRSRLTTSKDGKVCKYRWALIIPHIEDLETFAAIRRTSGFETVTYDNYFASGLSDASLHYLMQVAAQKTSDWQQLPGCDLWAFGDAAWSRQQCITNRQTVRLSPKLQAAYQVCDLQLRNGYKVGKNGTFIDVSFGREIAAENLVSGKPWYCGLNDVLKFNSEVFEQLYYERSRLHKMKEAMISKEFTPEMATLFGHAVTWQLRERFREVRRSTSSGKPNYDKVKTDLLMSIRDCRSQHDFVRLQTRVFSRPAGVRNPFLQGIELGDFYLWTKEHWQDCLSLMALAIVGYQDPWRVPRTAKILESKGWKKPKYLVEEEVQFDLYKSCADSAVIASREGVMD